MGDNYKRPSMMIELCDDRVLTMEELQKLLEYLDRRIKVIVFTMAY